MECRDVRDMADSFVGEELLTETNHEILRHMDTCPACRADLAARRALRLALRQAFLKAPDLDSTPEFRARLRITLQDTARTVKVRRRVRLSGWWALAATVLLAVTVGLAYRGREWVMATGALARAAVGDHRNCALEFRLIEKPISLEDAAQRYGAMYRVLEKLPPVNVTTPGGVVHVLERHACVYEGRRFAHVVLDYRGGRVSLLVTENGVRMAGAVFDAARLALHETRIDSMAVVSWRASHYSVFLVGDLAETDLAHLAQTIAAPLAQQLATV